MTSISYRDVVAIEPSRTGDLDDIAATLLVGDATGSGADRGAASAEDDPLAAATAGAIASEPSDEAPQDVAANDVDANLADAGITPLVLGSYTPGDHEWGEHVVTILRSASSTLEIRHRRLDHLPRR